MHPTGEEQEADVPPASATKRVLVADDDPVSLRLLERILVSLGYEVVLASSGEEAWKRIVDDGLRLALVDWMMPDVDGPALCRRLREAVVDGYVYVILVTSRDKKVDLIEALGAGADDYLTKPVDPRELDVRIKVGLRTLGLESRLAARVAELEEAVARVNALQRQLIQSEKLASLGQFSAGIAHEINNPLAAIMGFAELMRSQPNRDCGEVTEKILSNASRIQRIVLSLKRFYVPAKHTKTRINLGHVARCALSILKVHEAARNIEVALDEAPDDAVMADETQMMQVITNLVLNAFQAMPEGGRLRLATAVREQWVELTVQDTGQGIAAAHLDKIFDPFFTTKSYWQGTGLGLSVTHTIVQQHGGEILVQSEVGVGTTFTVRLPSALTAPPAIRVEPSGRPAPPNPAALAGRRVIVVDDEADCRYVLQTILEDLGCEVQEAASGSEAVRILDGCVDAVILDYRMPEMDGADTLRTLRRIDPGLPVVVITGSIRGTARQLCEGADAFLQKPFSREDVAVALQTALSRRRPEARPASA